MEWVSLKMEYHAVGYQRPSTAPTCRRAVNTALKVVWWQIYSRPKAYATLRGRHSLSCNAWRSLDRTLQMTITLRDFGFRQNWFKRFSSSWMLRCAAGNSAYSSWDHEHSDMKATRPPKRRNTLNYPLQKLTSRNTRILCITLRGCPVGHAYCWNLC